MIVRCPVCERTVVWKGNPHRPFCSERCRILDLGNWAEEKHRIAGEAISEEDVDEHGDVSRN
jgi:endogenous inhibitor of DNA gyrase (YacG/DUF329 family)